jgi:hypothetical protein
MPSKRNPDGYLEINNNGAEPPSPLLGIKEETIGGGVQHLETSFFMCSHCQRQVVVNPQPFRKAEPAYCPKCDHYICQQCNLVRVASGGVCKPFKQTIDELLTKAAKSLPAVSTTKESTTHG